MTKPKIDAGANPPGTLKTFLEHISKIWNLDFAAGDFSPGNLITLPTLCFTYHIIISRVKCRKSNQVLE